MGPEIRIVGRLHGTWPMQSVNKYIDKDYRMNENCQCQESKHWESGGGNGWLGIRSERVFLAFVIEPFRH